jgi:hypothetical protein
LHRFISERRAHRRLIAEPESQNGNAHPGGRTSLGRGAEAAVTRAGLAPVESAPPLFPELLIQPFREISETAGGISEASVLGFELLEALLEAALLRGELQRFAARSANGTRSRRFVGFHKEKNDHESSWSVRTKP